MDLKIQLDHSIRTLIGPCRFLCFDDYRVGLLLRYFKEKGFFNKTQNAYWFIPTEVKAGDRVVLYTRSGRDSFEEKDDGTTTYFRYWGLSEAIFTDPAKGIVLAEVANWKLSKRF